jgi:hypothetical protein
VDVVTWGIIASAMAFFLLPSKPRDARRLTEAEGHLSHEK